MQEGLGSIYLSSALKAFEQRGSSHSRDTRARLFRSHQEDSNLYAFVIGTSLPNMIWERRGGGVLLINFETCVYVTCNLK